MKLVFVCSGNTCRSPMAEKLAQQWLSNDPAAVAVMKVSSAGVAVFSGSSASPQSVQVMAEFGMNLAEHRARQFNDGIAREADLILTMTTGQKQVILQRYPAAEERVFTLTEFVGSNSGEITDPFGQSVEVYRKSAQDLQALIDKALHKILNHP